MGKNYSHFTLDERCRLAAFLEMGLSKKEIARRLGCHRSAVYRELGRNSNADGVYKPSTATARATARKRRGSKIEHSSELTLHVEDRLAMGWSPEQISARLELEGSCHRLSHETIYRYVYSPAGRISRLHRFLAHRKSRRGRRRRYEYRGPSIPDRVPISERPPEVETRAEFGHWEGDLMLFSRKRDILLTLTERQTRMTIMQRLDCKRADDTAEVITSCLQALPEAARKTITLDNGGEFARHTKLTETLGLQAYFCDPHSPWQRGAIENANGRIRRELPRKTKLTDYTDGDINALNWMINETPRKCLQFKTPIEAFTNQLNVALEK